MNCATDGVWQGLNHDREWRRNCAANGYGDVNRDIAWLPFACLPFAFGLLPVCMLNNVFACWLLPFAFCLFAFCLSAVLCCCVCCCYCELRGGQSHTLLLLLLVLLLLYVVVVVAAVSAAAAAAVVLLWVPCCRLPFACSGLPFAMCMLPVERYFFGATEYAKRE